MHAFQKQGNFFGNIYMVHCLINWPYRPKQNHLNIAQNIFNLFQKLIKENQHFFRVE